MGEPLPLYSDLHIEICAADGYIRRSFAKSFNSISILTILFQLRIRLVEATHIKKKGKKNVDSG